MKRLLFWSIIFLLLISGDGFPFGIEPARLELSIPAGRQKGKTIIIDNSKEDTPVHIRIYPQDITYLPDGTHDFLPAGSTSWSCSNWIKVVPDELDIPARKRGSVRISVEVPPGAKGGGYSTLFFEAGLPGARSGMTVALRIGVMVLVTIPGTEIYKARLSNISFTKPKDIEVSIYNESNLFIRPQGLIKVLDAKGKRMRAYDSDLNPNKLGILPGTLRKFNIELKKALPKGKYTLKTEVDFGQDYLLIGELPIDLE